MDTPGASPVPGAGSSADPIIPGSELNDGGSNADPDIQVDSQVDDTTPQLGPDGQPIVEGKEPVVEDGKQDGRVIPKWMKDLQASNPEAYQKAKADLFEMRDRRSVHPTIQAAREEHNLVQSLGGQEGVTRLREDAGIFKTAANQFLKGDPAFVKDLWDEDPIAAALHVQPMLEAYRGRDPEGYKSAVTRLWDQEFQAVGFGGGLKGLLDSINKKDFDSALTIANSFKDWYESINQVARKAEDPRVKSLLAERAKQRDDATKTQQQEFLKDYRTKATDAVVDGVAKVFDSYFKGRKLDADDRTALLRDAVRLANEKVEADKDFMQQRQQHLDNGDSHSALQMTKARFDREMTDAVKRIARRYGLVSGAPAGAKPNTAHNPQAGKVEQGWTVVNQRPSAEQIDRNVTSNEMIIYGRAILLDGKKVDWSKLKQQ